MEYYGYEESYYKMRKRWRDRVEYKIEENEELIGVYGDTTQSVWLTSLGFIVKVKQSE